jgi:hypothetical protein
VAGFVKILAVVQDPALASSRIRIADMLPVLGEHGLEGALVPYPKSLAGVLSLVPRARAFDLVWLQKKLPNALDALVWRGSACPIVFDFDDAICFRKDPKGGSYRSRAREAKFARAIRLASAVTCGNGYLRGLLPDPTKPAALYPSPVPLPRSVKAYGRREGAWVVGWVGGGGNLSSLAAIAPALEEVSRRHPLVLRVVSDQPFSSPGLRVENVSWTLEGAEDALASFDVGVMPLDARSPFDLGKCSYKLLQYMAAGVASVADAVGMNCEVLEDGRNGRLVRTGESWASVLDEVLAGGADELARLGGAGRRTVEERFTYDRLAEKLETFFRSIVRAK